MSDTDNHDGHDHAKDHAHGVIFGINIEFLFAIVCGVCVGVGWLLDVLTPVHWGVPLGLYLAGYFFGGWFTVREAIDKVRAGKFEIDFLMLVAAAGAAALGEFFEGSLLLFLFSIGHALENYAMGRARRAIEALADLVPATARCGATASWSRCRSRSWRSVTLWPCGPMSACRPTAS